jgi:beta-phosphoglucomutase-like phosphatase (HAD superfamily)
MALEDSANGLQAALAAKLPVLITHNRFTAHHDFTGAVRVLSDLRDTTLAHLRAWHEEATRP